jgi:hypothetical protein
MNTDSSEQIPVRTTRKLMEACRQHALWTGRTLSEEVRGHVEVGVARRMLLLLGDSEFVAALQAERSDADVAALREEAEGDLRTAEARAYGPGPVHLRLTND